MRDRRGWVLLCDPALLRKLSRHSGLISLAAHAFDERLVVKIDGVVFVTKKKEL